jgi:hypothetical protein
MWALAFNQNQGGKLGQDESIEGQPFLEHNFKSYRLGCRCEVCRAANAKEQREYQARRKARHAQLLESVAQDANETP